MSDDELRAAAEQMVAWEYGTPTPGISGFQAMSRRLLELLPPADDGEALTADWLLAVGFVPDPQDVSALQLPLVKEPYPSFLSVSADPGHPNDGGEVAFQSEDPADARFWEFIVASDPDRVRTRGHVSRLAAALGFPLKEPA